MLLILIYSITFRTTLCQDFAKFFWKGVFQWNFLKIEHEPFKTDYLFSRFAFKCNFRPRIRHVFAFGALFITSRYINSLNRAYWLHFQQMNFIITHSVAFARLFFCYFLSFSPLRQSPLVLVLSIGIDQNLFYSLL